MHEDACVANLYKEFVADRFQPIAPSSLAIAYRLAEVYNANCQDMISARSIDAYLLIICGYIKRKRVSHDTIIITMFSTIELDFMINRMIYMKKAANLILPLKETRVGSFYLLTWSEKGVRWIFRAHLD